MACQIDSCTFPYTHTSRNHLCGKCNRYGHGRKECGNLFKINKLRIYYNDKLSQEIQCTFNGCINKEYHTTEAHTCDGCNKRLHSKETCPNMKKIYEIKCPICNTINIFDKIQKAFTSESNICCICMDNNIDIYLPGCAHICICTECLIKLDIKNDQVLLNLINNIRSEQMLTNFNLDLIKSKLKYYPSFIKIIDDSNNISVIRRLNEQSELEEFYVPNNVNSIEEIDIFTRGYSLV